MRRASCSASITPAMGCSWYMVVAVWDRYDHSAAGQGECSRALSAAWRAAVARSYAWTSGASA
jgi:hypothetical protein